MRGSCRKLTCKLPGLGCVLRMGARPAGGVVAAVGGGSGREGAAGLVNVTEVDPWPGRRPGQGVGEGAQLAN